MQLRIEFILLWLASTSSLAEPPSPTMSDYTLCAVYHRMMAGSFQSNGRDYQAMAEREKMDSLIKKAKHLAREEFGDELAEESFLDEWRTVLANMNDQINRNYVNISRIKYRYKNRCTALHEKPD